MTSRIAKIGPNTARTMKTGDVVWDTSLRRFGVRKRAKTVTYFVKARIDGRQRWIGVGRDGPVTAAQARAKAKAFLGVVDAKGDPTREREHGKKLPLFCDFAEDWLKKHVEVKRKPNTAREYRRIVERHLTPALGKVRIDRIDRADALKVHGDLAEQPYIANRVIAVLSAIMSFAEQAEKRPQQSNPCRGLERYKEKKRKRPLKQEETAALWAYLERLSCQGNPYVVGAIRLLLLTGMRREEVLTLQHTAIDIKNGVINLQDAKTGPRVVVLSSEAIRILDALPIIDGNPYVFPGQREAQRLVNISKTWRAIRTALKFPDVRIHDLRHTVASMLARSAPLIVVRDALGHSEISTTSDYSHGSREDIRTAVETLASQIASPK